MNVAFVFPGQGSQSVGMGRALFDAFPEARRVFEEIDEALGESLSKLCFDGPEDRLRLTANAQPALLAVSAAAHAVFASRAPKATFYAGHSLGEYSALVAANAMGLADAARAVRARGTFMQEAVPEGVGAMAAVLGLPPERVREACAAASQGEVVAPANYNSPEQTVISGAKDAVARASEEAKRLGAKRVLPLPVSAPFHCALMAPVQARLAPVLAALTFQDPRGPVVANVTAEPNSDARRIASLLVEQVTAPVRWVESVQKLRALGVTDIVELGAGTVLAGLCRRIDSTLKSRSARDAASLETALRELAA